ncbi:MAG: histidinol-phosphate transaminase [Clostridiales bacterium]|jgi:histidinol-phosphate aminotransferase|nr:histidinol-phosphate transaminase [Clostridiales bacterium]
MSEFLSRRFDGMKPYAPGEQPQGREYVKLNTNESPYPPAPGVIDALGRAAAERLNLYPDPKARSARAAIAASLGVRPENVILGNGSDELLAFCFQAFCDAGAPAVYHDIAYGFYKVFARALGAPSRVVPLESDFGVDVDKLCPAGGTLVLANPNAPTGLALPISAIEAILRANPRNVVVIDEAYAEFGAESALPLIAEHGNLIVMRTMSKSRNLAGARLGYAVASEPLIADLNRMRFSFNPYNVNALSLLAAEASVRDEAYFRQCVGSIAKTRRFASDALQRRGFELTRSLANFLFARPGFMGGGEYYARLKEKGVLVRHFADERISGHVRITVGTAEQMQALLDATDEIIAAGGSAAAGESIALE